MRQLPTVFPDTLASGCGEFGVVSATDQAVSVDSFVPDMLQPMYVHLLHSIRCHFYVPTTARRPHQPVYMMTLVLPVTSNHVQHTPAHAKWKQH